MNRNLERILIFITGGLIGAYGMYKLINKRYSDIANEEIESVREMYRQKEKNERIESKTMDTIIDESIEEARKTKEEYEKIITESNYLTNSDIENEHINEDVTTELEEYKNPYIITPEEYGEKSDYEMSSLTLYEDGVLCDENDEEISDIEDFLGTTLEYFGIYDDNALFVRNDSKKHDYEIIKVEEDRYPKVEPVEEEEIE